MQKDLLIDIHTHLPAPKPGAIISCGPDAMPVSDTFPGQMYAVGIHPWDISPSGVDEELKQRLYLMAEREDVAAIGECGIDMSHPGAAPLYEQLLTFKTHIELSERVGKPLIIHCVKAWDSVIALRKEYAPSQRWLIHGFRGKPQVLEMLFKAGIDISYGEKFNPESVAATPADRLFAETDESELSINDIIATLGAVNPEATTTRIAQNVRGLLAR
ncbi:MAG: TatD family hydrolase [Muribaculaceae bacterium]|nr:TatD family hydrolase [Muribaculaceae bacterium]